MPDVKTNLGNVNKEIIEEGPVQGRKTLTYVLIAVAVMILLYVVYSKWLVYQSFWGGKKAQSKDDDSDSDDEESQKKPKSKKEDDDGDDWSVEEEIQKIETEQSRLFRHREE